MKLFKDMPIGIPFLLHIFSDHEIVRISSDRHAERNLDVAEDSWEEFPSTTALFCPVKDWFEQGEEPNTSHCNHVYVERKPLTSTYVACLRCGKEVM